MTVMSYCTCIHRCDAPERTEAHILCFSPLELFSTAEHKQHKHQHLNCLYLFTVIHIHQQIHVQNVPFVTHDFDSLALEVN